MDNDEQWLIDSLKRRDISEADLSNSIEVLEILFSFDALAPLVAVIEDSSRTLSIREQAANAICKIGPESVKKELNELLRSGSPETQRLAQIAMQ